MAHSVPALERAIAVMNALAEGGEATSLGLAKRLGISQSSCYRILQTLQAADWIRPTDDGYAFSDGLRPFLTSLMAAEALNARLEPAMADLTMATGLSVKLSERQGVEQVTVARVESPRPLAATSPVGARFPVVLGASGAALMSQLADDMVERQIAYANEHALWAHESEADLRARLAACREHGVCENVGTHPRGVDTVSAPLSLAQGQFALTLVGLHGDFEARRLATCRVALLDSIRSIHQTEALA